ncbi:endolytic transglycosylase MltG [Simiduia curdlanivorans]|uniref:Endolytic murein transglycosylase n=1 Tax=Simiduia curdlanivorans TaxID=1492769 RepID=A0ABV8V9W2_9GAMM|nr:endolytic transglycosylase MltG [Simiduia curdlanivorans]MDN3639740.1 endolytic transglycosylase MltG [Simiduia curdlanivorans]
MKAIIKWLFILSFVAVSLAVGLGFYVKQVLDTPMAISDVMQLEVPRGQSLIALGNRLERQGLLNATLWVGYARIVGATKIKSGEYKIEPGLSPKQLLDKLLLGDVIRYSAQLVEGWTYGQALQYLQSLEHLEIRLAGLLWPAQQQLLGLEENHPEGLFFPDTYQYQKGDSDVSLLRQAYAKQQMILTELWAERAENLPYRTPYEALIMASIVEKETAIDAEREEIAGVFVRRLQKNMRLQTDPTVIYGLGQSYRGNLSRKHLTQATAYNTYVIKGLPPTPIALSGERSLFAALHPDNGTSLYFVAKGDGYHQFSTTLDEHNAAVKKFQLKRRSDYRSTPQQ